MVDDVVDFIRQIFKVVKVPQAIIGAGLDRGDAEAGEIFAGDGPAARRADPRPPFVTGSPGSLAISNSR